MEKILNNVRFHGSWIWRIKPYYFSHSCSLTIFLLKTLATRCILQLLFKTTHVQCVLVNGNWFINYIFTYEVSDILFAKDFGNCFRTFWGWVDCLFIKIEINVWKFHPFQVAMNGDRYSILFESFNLLKLVFSFFLFLAWRY